MMMCETMANIPIEEKTSYVLTQDMIDAAMNEQFAFQEDLESEAESSSQEDSMDQDSQESCVTDTVGVLSSVENDSSVTDPNIKVNTKPSVNICTENSPISSNNKVSVLVIETGLDKNGGSIIKSSKEIKNANTLNGSLNDTVYTRNETGGATTQTGDQNTSEDKRDLTILKTILSSNKDQEGVIDLCDSDVEDFPEEDDLNEAETIDDELKSVMETNLMAEIGMVVNKKSVGEPHQGKQNSDKSSETFTPRISVKNIAQISAHAFNSLPQSGLSNSGSYSEGPKMNRNLNEDQCGRNSNLVLRPPNPNANIPTNGNNQGPSPIHISKIAVPHSTFLNTNGQRMKCLYVKNTTSFPFVINTPTQTTAANTNMKYVLSQPLKKGPVQMPAINALKNLTKNLQPQAVLLQKNPKVLSVSQKLQKPLMLQNIPSAHPNQTMKRNAQHLEAMRNSILSIKKRPYVPPNTFPENPTYTCLDCNDKFLLRTSLTNHLDRRSVSIRVWCQPCKSELQFYNRCALSVHLRAHNINANTLKTIDASCITINPIPKEMIEKGIVSMFLKDNEQNTSQPGKTVGPSLNDKVVQTSTISSNCATSRGKSTVPASNLSSQKITTVTGQSKSVCYQTPGTSTTANSQSSNKPLPLILPKPMSPVKAVALVSTQSVANPTKEQATSSIKSPKSVILFCNKLPQSSSAHQNSTINTIPPNVVCEAGSQLNSSPVSENYVPDMVIDDDVSVVPDNTEEEIVDIENYDGNITSMSTPTESNLESEKTSLGKGKKNPSITTKRRHCSECKAYCPNISKHLNGPGRPLSLDLACKICNLILPSSCALKIHLRIHMKISPHKCPDCGKDFTTWDELHAHLKFSCGHFAKCVRFICKGCKAHFPTKSGLAQHIVKNHGKDIFKCSLCPVAFYKKQFLIKHILSEHPKEKHWSKVGMDYKQCEMCPKKLLPEESYLVHAKEHSNSMIYGYKCSMCNIIYANKMAFIIHQIKEKTKKEPSDVTGNQTRPIVNKEPLEEDGVQDCDSNSDFEDEPVIVRKYPESNDEFFTTEKDPLSLDDWEGTKEQKIKVKTEELCIVCKKNSVVLLPGIDLNTQSLCCKQCVRPLDGDSSTEPSKQQKNGASRPRPKSNKNKQSKPKAIYRSSSTDVVKSVPKKRRVSDISHISSSENEHSFDPLVNSPLRKKNKKKQKEKLDPKGQTHIHGQVIKSRSLDELCLKCAKCKFFTEKRESFLEHITVHRTDPNTYQCLECGLCFVVLPSLERHLQMHHGIKDVSSYTENNKGSLPQKTVSIEEETQDNQCRVCHEIFDSKPSLDKHFRIHGMAFMSRLSKSP